MKRNLMIGIVTIAAMLAIILSGCATTTATSEPAAETASAQDTTTDAEPAAETTSSEEPEENPFEPLVDMETSETVFEPDLSDPVAAEQTFEYWGTVDPFNRVEVFDGAIEMEGSNGMEGFGVFFKPEFDLAKGPLSISMDVVRNSEGEGSEICLWFVNQYMADGDPWTQGDFLRVMLLSTGNQLVVQQTNFEERGVGKDIAKKFGVFEMGQPVSLELRMTQEAYMVLLNGEEAARGLHDLPEPTGYLHVHDWNSLEGNVDYISNIIVRQ